MFLHEINGDTLKKEGRFAEAEREYRYAQLFIRYSAQNWRKDFNRITDKIIFVESR
jgi:hypothetical protein